MADEPTRTTAPGRGARAPRSEHSTGLIYAVLA